MSTRASPLRPYFAALADEVRRRDAAWRRGNLWTGCPVLDEDVMRGGFERGSIVGVSIQTPSSVGPLIVIQMITKLMMDQQGASDAPLPQVHVATAMAPGSFATSLASFMVRELRVAFDGDLEAAKARAAVFLGRVIITQVVDLADLLKLVQAHKTVEVTPRAVKNEETATIKIEPLPGPRILAFLQNQAGEPTQQGPDEGVHAPSSPDPLDVSHAQHGMLPTPNIKPPVQPIKIEEECTIRGTLKTDLLIVLNTHNLILKEYNKYSSKEGFHQTLKRLGASMRDMAHGAEAGTPLVVLLNGVSQPYDAKGTSTSTKRDAHTQAPLRPTNLRPQYEDFLHSLVDVSLLFLSLQPHQPTATAVSSGDSAEQAASQWLVTVVEDRVGVWKGDPPVDPETFHSLPLDSRELGFGIISVKNNRLDSSASSLPRQRAAPRMPGTKEPLVYNLTAA
ncbi:hypothetical protein GQ53DRAFT_750400 [Thozetella sp. PMI_491]|nr:hypothetical protein GQ53DRAFT_750400 [Thozetella sp. PMI_491]